MNRSVIILSIIILILIALIYWLGSTLLYKKNSVSHNFKEVHREYIDAFWVEDDDDKAYKVLKANAEKIILEHKNRKLTAYEADAEMKIVTDFAAMATNLYPEEGMRVFAEIYNNQNYSSYIRANALLHAMFYPIEKIGTEGFTVKTANDWIFREGRFASVLEGSSLEGRDLKSEREVFEASVIGLTKAEELTNSNKLRVKITSLKLDVMLNLLVDDIMSEKESEVWTRMNQEDWSSDTGPLAEMRELLSDFNNLQENLETSFQDRNTWPIFIDQFAHAAKNMLRSYTTMQAFGIETGHLFDPLYTATTNYMNEFKSEVGPIEAEQVKAYSGINAFYKACSDVMHYNYIVDNEEKINSLNNTLQPFFNLSYSDLRIFVVTKALGERRAGACYQPFVVIGSKIPAFQEALINGVGGWQSSQFE